jgi:hypothetical protein
MSNKVLRSFKKKELRLYIEDHYGIMANCVQLLEAKGY